MWNTPSKKTLATIPRLYETEHIPLQEKVIHLHFFIGGCDWFLSEFDGEDLFWGFAILNNDYMNAEWGYISFSELKDINIRGVEIDNDLHWKVRPANEVEQIIKASRRWIDRGFQPAVELTA
jgi:hypothetical protein